MHVIHPQYIQLNYTPHSAGDPSNTHFIYVFAMSYAFYLDQPSTLIPMHEFASKTNPLLELYQSGIDECLPKNKAEFIAFGKAVCPKSQTVTIKVGTCTKTLKILPPNVWQKTSSTYKIIPKSNSSDTSDLLIHYKSAFGGTDYKQNPIGQGHIRANHTQQLTDEQQAAPLPQILYPNQKLPTTPFDIIKPSAGFSPIMPHWETRAQHIKHDPSSPDAFKKDPLFYQSAPEDQWLSEDITPNMSFQIEGMSENPISGTLPNYKVRLFVKPYPATAKTKEIPTIADTLVFFPNENIGVITFRAKIKTKDILARENEKYLIAIEHDTNTPNNQHDQQQALSKYTNAMTVRTTSNKALHAASENDLIPETLATPESQEFDQYIPSIIQKAPPKSIYTTEEFGSNASQPGGAKLDLSSFNHQTIQNQTYTHRTLSDHVLQSITFIETHFEYCRFDAMSLDQTIFQDCVFEHCIFENSSITKTTLSHTTWLSTQSTSLKLSNNIWDNCHWIHCQFSECVFNEQSLKQMLIDHSIQTKNQWKSSQMIQNTFSALISDQEVYLDNNFHSVGLSGESIIFQNTEFHDNTFTACNLKESQWTDCQCESDIFDGCHFNESVFDNVSWLNVNAAQSHFTGITINNSNLQESDFTKTNFIGAKKNDATYFKTCIMTDSILAHSNIPKSGSTYNSHDDEESSIQENTQYCDE